MKAVRPHARGGLESLRFEDAPTPRSGAGNLDFVRALGADDVIDYLWNVFPVPSEAKHENMTTFERNDGGFCPPFAHEHHGKRESCHRRGVAHDSG
jgi:hypothetical protein